NATFKIEPISPRPLPAYDSSKEPAPAAKGIANNLQGKAGENAKEDDSKAEWVTIHMLDGDQRDFRVKRANIKGVQYWEDMLIAEGDRLVQTRNFAKAFEYYLAVQARNPNWKGLQDHVDRLLFEEGTWALAGNERDRGMRLLHELSSRRPEF